MKVKGFDWDEGNIDKNWKKHRVANRECEEVFFDPWLIVYYDKGHSIKETRYHLLGKTLGEKKLFVTFACVGQTYYAALRRQTTRDDKIRVISARNMSERERREYDKYKKKDTSF